MEKALEILKDLCLVLTFNSYWKPRVDEAIAELEEAMNRTCSTCEYDGTFRYMGKDAKCTRCCNFFSNRYVPKEK